MNIPVNLFMWIMAFLPIIVLIVLMVKFHWGATEAAPVGLVITVITGLLFYKANISLIAEESAKGIWNAIVILLIVWTAILLYQVGDQAKAFMVIRNGMRRLLPNELLLILAMGWVFESFLQGITGFGVPVAVGAPLLIGIGVSPLYAVVLPLLGQAWGNTFGTLAAAWDSLAMSSGMTVGGDEYFKTALWAAIFLLFWDAVTGVVMCWFYGRGKAVVKGLPAVIVMTVIQGGGQLFLSQINTTLCCFIPSVVSLVVLMLMGRMKMYRDEWSVEDSPIMSAATFSNLESKGGSRLNEIVQAVCSRFSLDPEVFSLDVQSFTAAMNNCASTNGELQELLKNGDKEGNVGQLVNRLTMYFADEIISGRLHRGDQIATDRELAKQLGVGRSAIREALKVLDILGMIDIRLGQGTYLVGQESNFFAVPLSWSLFLDGGQIMNILEVRNVLELKSAELAASCDDEAKLAKLTDVYHEMYGSHGEYVNGAICCVLQLKSEFQSVEVAGISI